MVLNIHDSMEDHIYFDQVVEHLLKKGVSRKPDLDTVIHDKGLDLPPKKSAELFLLEWKS